MKIESIERINFDRIGLWVCVQFDGKMIEDDGLDAAEKILEYVNSDKSDTFLIDDEVFHKINKFNTIIYIGCCSENSMTKNHWLLEYNPLFENGYLILHNHGIARKLL